MGRKLLASAVVAASIAAISSPAAGASGNAHAACKQAVIGGQSKCLARGQYCSRGKQSQYRRYGFSCSKRDNRGRYHLQ